MRRGIKRTLSGITGLVIIWCGTVWAAAEEQPVPGGAAVVGAAVSEAAKNAPPPPGFTAKSAILIEQLTMTPLCEYNADEKLAPASITKVMTMLLVMEALDSGLLGWEDMVVCSEYASSMGGSQIWLEPNEQMTVRDLMKATAVGSANDAATALAEHLSGTEQAFVERMNAKAAELGMANTHFINCTGLDEEGHYTSARDITVMAAELLKHPDILEFSGIWMDELRGGETQLVNTNKLIYHYQGATGLKTGSTDNAGRCLCATAERNGMKLISVVLGAPSGDAQFGESRALLDWGFGNFECVQPKAPDSLITPLKVAHGTSETVELSAVPPEAVVVARGEGEKLMYEVTLQEEVTAPVEVDQTVGEVVGHVDSREVCRFPVKTLHAVPRMTFGRALLHLLKSLAAL